MSIIKPGQEFRVVPWYQGEYFASNEVIVIHSLTGQGDEMVITNHAGFNVRQLPIRILERLVKVGWLIPLDEPAQPAQPRIQMEKPMSKVRIVDVFLFDDTAGLKAEDRLIAKYENITTDGSDTDIIVDLALNHDIKAQLAHHNAKRTKTVNEELLNRVGKKVMLLPIEAKQIEYRIREVASL